MNRWIRKDKDLEAATESWQLRTENMRLKRTVTLVLWKKTRQVEFLVEEKRGITRRTYLFSFALYGDEITDLIELLATIYESKEHQTGEGAKIDE